MREKYYFARGPQYVNQVVDIGGFMDRKIAVNLLNTAQGLRLALLGDNDETPTGSTPASSSWTATRKSASASP